MTQSASSFTPRTQHPTRSLADTIQLLTLKAPKEAAALKVIAEMVLARVLSAEESPH